MFNRILFYQSLLKKGDKMKKFVLIALLPIFLITLSGCAVLVVGAAAGALGACAVSKDTVQGESDKSYDSLWESALDVAKAQGLVQQENVNTGYIELGAQSSKVWIKLIRLTRATTRIRVSARRYHFPNFDLAQDIFVKIVTGAK